MNRRAFLLGTAAVALAPVAAVRSVGFNPLLAAPYASGGYVSAESARRYLERDMFRYVEMYRSHVISRATIRERIGLLTGCDYAGIEARVLAHEEGPQCPILNP